MGFGKEQVAHASQLSHGVFERTLQILLNPKSRCDLSVSLQPEQKMSSLFTFGLIFAQHLADLR